VEKGFEMPSITTTKLGKTRRATDLMHRTPVPVARAEAIMAAMASTPTESRSGKEGPKTMSSPENSDSEFPEEKSQNKGDRTPLSLRRTSPLLTGLAANIPRHSLANLRIVAADDEDNISLSDLSRVMSMTGQKTSYNIGAGSSTVEVHNHHASPLDVGMTRASETAARAKSEMTGQGPDAAGKRKSRDVFSAEATAAGGASEKSMSHAAPSTYPPSGNSGLQENELRHLMRERDIQVEVARTYGITDENLTRFPGVIEAVRKLNAALSRPSELQSDSDVPQTYKEADRPLSEAQRDYLEGMVRSPPQVYRGDRGPVPRARKGSVAALTEELREAQQLIQSLRLQQREGSLPAGGNTKVSSPPRPPSNTRPVPRIDAAGARNGLRGSGLSPVIGTSAPFALRPVRMDHHSPALLAPPGLQRNGPPPDPDDDGSDNDTSSMSSGSGPSLADQPSQGELQNPHRGSQDERSVTTAPSVNSRTTQGSMPEDPYADARRDLFAHLVEQYCHSGSAPPGPNAFMQTVMAYGLYLVTAGWAWYHLKLDVTGKGLRHGLEVAPMPAVPSIFPGVMEAGVANIHPNNMEQLDQCMRETLYGFNRHGRQLSRADPDNDIARGLNEAMHDSYACFMEYIARQARALGLYPAAGTRVPTSKTHVSSFFTLYIFYVFWTQRWFYDCHQALTGTEGDINFVAGSLIKNLDTHFGTYVKSALEEPLEEMTLIYGLRFLRYRCPVCREYGGGLATCLTRSCHPLTPGTPGATAAIHVWNKARTVSVNASLKAAGTTKTRVELESEYEVAHPRPVHVAASAGPLSMAQILQQQTKIPLPPTVILPLLHRSI
jgi:hypothetical protein